MPTFDPPALPTSGIASVFVTCRADGTLLPNVRCDVVELLECPNLPRASFSYILDSTDPDSPYPFLFEELWPIQASGPYVVLPGDELLVYEYTEAGDEILVFHGFARAPQVTMGPGMTATFEAVSVGIRLADTPIQGAVYRDANDPQEGGIWRTGNPVWFNEAHTGKPRPNCTPSGSDVNQGADDAYPVFLDWRIPAQDGKVVQAFWTLPGFVRYLCWTVNPDETYVQNPIGPDGLVLDDYLLAAKPNPGSQTYDPTRPSTYVLEPITIRSFDSSNKRLLDAVCEQLHYYDFHLFLNTRANGDGDPVDELIVYRVDGRDGVAPKQLNYPEQGTLISQDWPDFNSFGLVRDDSQVFNEVVVETGNDQYEVTVVLVCGFPVSSADGASASAIKAFSKTDPAFPNTNRDKYRLYVFDEAGLGHWNGSAMVTGGATDLSDVLGDRTPVGGGEEPGDGYVNRLRPGSNSLITTDQNGKPLKARLAISTDYAGAAPAVWDTTGTWQPIAGGFDVLKDRLGVWINVANPNSWSIGKPTQAGVPFPAGTVKGVELQAGGGGTGFYLRLTTVIKGDSGIEATASKRPASPTPFTVRRRVDAKEHFLRQYIVGGSEFNQGGDTYAKRDDTAKAQALADQLRNRGEFPPVAGPIVLPGIRHDVGIGDLISQINGRDVSLRTNAGSAAGEGPRYPYVVAVRFSCQNPQTTTLHLSDMRLAPEDAAHGYGRST